MALIKCPDCGTEVSDLATACIRCGCPLGAQPTYIRFGKVGGQMYMNKCYVYCNGEEHACRQGDYIALKITTPTEIEVKMQNCFGRARGTVEPGQTYTADINGFGKVILRKG